jgi:hypothetical protein
MAGVGRTRACAYPVALYPPSGAQGHLADAGGSC